MHRFLKLSLVLVLVGCGTAPEASLPAADELPPDWIEALRGPPGPPGPEGPQGVAGDITLLSWARFYGSAPAEVAVSGGVIDVLSFSRTSEGVYRIVYDVRTKDIGLVVAIGTAAGFELQDGENVTTMLGIVQDVDAVNLTLEVVSVLSVLDPSLIRLADFDALFNVVVFGNLPD